MLRILFGAALLVGAAIPALAADDILDAIEQTRKAYQSGDIMMLVANKFLINVQGSADAAAKLSYAQALDIAKLSKM